MAIIAAIALKDSANATKNYLPERVQTGSYASWVNRDQGTSVGNKRASVRTVQKKGSYDKVHGSIVHPVVNATTGLCDFTNSVSFDTQIHERATAAQKQEIMFSLAAMLGLAPVQALVTTGESISG